MSDHPELFFIHRMYPAGNDCVFWREKSQGYCCDLLQAGRYTAKEVERLRLDPMLDRPVPCHVAEAVVVHHVVWPLKVPQ